MKKRVTFLLSHMPSVLSNLLLLLSGDVEANPGPMSKAEAEAFDSALAAIRKLETGLGAVLTDLKTVKDNQEITRNEIKALTAQIAALGSNVSSSATASPSSNNTLQTIATQLKTITSRCDDAENRMRRSNLLFFGIEDDEKEDWAGSEEKIISFCSEKLQIPTTSAKLERVHRLGKFTAEKNRPIIAKFTSFKDKDNILSRANKLKGTDYAIGEDFSFSTRLARRKLVSFARNLDKPFKLTVDKLHIDKKTYIYDNATDTVVLCKR